MFAIKGHLDQRKRFELSEVAVVTDAEFLEFLDQQTKPKKGGK